MRRSRDPKVEEVITLTHSSDRRINVLFAGESSVTYAVEQWGFSANSTGSYHESHDAFAKALEPEGVEFTYLPNHRATERFPWTPDELQLFDVVILSDIPANTLLLHPDTFVRNVRTPNRLQSIVDYVGGGGGLLMIGGYMSFSGMESKAGYHFTPLAEILPIHMYGFDDRVETPEGVVPEVVVDDHPILRGISGDWPYLLGYNKLMPRDSAEVLLRCNGDPLLAVDTVGKGRTAAFASDCVGHWGSRDFMGWSGYAPFWSQLVRWLANSEQVSD